MVKRPPQKTIKNNNTHHLPPPHPQKTTDKKVKWHLFIFLCHKTHLLKNFLSDYFQNR